MKRQNKTKDCSLVRGTNNLLSRHIVQWDIPGSYVLALDNSFYNNQKWRDFAALVRPTPGCPPQEFPFTHNFNRTRTPENSESLRAENIT
jgi:hypothetical protein